MSLMTIHAAKGLEFPVVFIAGVEDGIIPHARSVEESELGIDGGAGGIEEERRLFYVAITRAQDKLYISSCASRRKGGSRVECSPSPFIDEIPDGIVEAREGQRQEELSAAEAVDILAKMRTRFGK